MQNVRIVELPKMRVVTSGAITNEEDFKNFDKWYKESEKNLSSNFMMLNFRWYNDELKSMESLYMMPSSNLSTDNCKYKIFDFDFGFYAVSSCIDSKYDDYNDWISTRLEIEKWVNDSDCFDIANDYNDKHKRYTMFHITSPELLYKRKGIYQQDIYVPIVLK